MEQLERIKILLQLSDTSKDDLLIVLIEQAEAEFKNCCNLANVPNTAANLINEMVLVKYTKLGVEGLASQSFSGISDSFIDGYPSNIVKALNKYRKAKFL